MLLSFKVDPPNTEDGVIESRTSQDTPRRPEDGEKEQQPRQEKILAEQREEREKQRNGLSDADRMFLEEAKQVFEQSHAALVVLRQEAKLRHVRFATVE